MPSVRKNKIQVPLNSDAYNLVPDLTTMADTANVFPKVASASERNGLASPANGDKVVRTDLPGAPIETYDGTNWQEPWIDYGAPVAIAGNWSLTGRFWGIRLGARTQVVGTVTIVRTTSTFALAGGGVAYSNFGQIIPTAALSSSTGVTSYAMTNFLTGNGASDLVQMVLNPITGELSARGYPGAISWVVAAQVSFPVVYMA